MQGGYFLAGGEEKREKEVGRVREKERWREMEGERGGVGKEEEKRKRNMYYRHFPIKIFKASLHIITYRTAKASLQSPSISCRKRIIITIINRYIDK